MKKVLKTILLTALALMLTLSLGLIAVGCGGGNGDGGNGDGGNGDGGNGGNATAYVFTVVYPDGSAVNGATDGTGGMNEDTAYIQLCDASGEQCYAPQKIGADGKVTVDKATVHAQLGDGELHVKIIGAPAGYSAPELNINSDMSEITVTLVAAAE